MIRAVAIVCAVFSSIAFGQTSTSPPTFEVASVKINTSEEPSSGDARNGRLTLHNIPMKVIISRAYQVSNDRVMGPGWIDTEHYDVVAKFAPDTPADTLWLMLQNLLADRFKLTAHHEQKPVSVYALLVGKNGPKLKNAASDSVVKSNCSPEGSRITCQSQKTTMAQLAQNLPRWVPRGWFDLPVVDLTDLKGYYDLSLTWTPTNRPLSADSGAEAAAPDGDDLFAAIQEQLGLKLEQRKAPVDKIVIDHMERVPVEN